MSVLPRLARRVLGVAVLGVVATGAAIFGTVAPAVAAPTVTFVDGCSFVRILIDSDWVRPMTPYAVLRNGSPADAGKTTSGDLVTALAAFPGDTYDFKLDGVLLGTHTYTTPDGCVEPKVEISFEDACQNGVVIRFRNVGSGYVSGFSMPVDGMRSVFPGVFPGTTEEHHVGPITSPMEIQWTASEGVPVTVATHTRREPAGCGAASLSIRLTALCNNKTQIDATNTAKGGQSYATDIGPASTRIYYVPPGSQTTNTLHLSPGRLLRIWYFDSDGTEILITEYTVPAGCGAQPESNPGAAQPGTNAAGGLPVTGERTGPLAGLGLTLFLAGLGCYLASRRRRATAAPRT